MTIPDRYYLLLSIIAGGEDFVLDTTKSVRRAYWRLTLKPMCLRSLRFLERRGLIEKKATHAPGITVWGASPEGKRVVA